MSNCPKCHATVLPNSQYCEACGQKLTTSGSLGAISNVFGDSLSENVAEQKAVTASSATTNQLPRQASDARKPLPFSRPIGQTPQPKASSGSLRSNFSMLSGATGRIKARLDSFKPATDNQANQASSTKKSSPSEDSPTNKFNIIAAVVTGIAVVAFWVWLLLKKVAKSTLNTLQKI